MNPITYPTKLPDNDGDGIIVSSGKIAVLGPKGTQWVFKEETADGQYIYWPLGYTPPVPVKSEPEAPVAPEGPFTEGAKMQFVRGSTTVSKQTFPSTSAVRKLDDGGVIVDSLTLRDLVADRVGRLLYMPGGSAIRRLLIERVSSEGTLKGQPFIGIRGLTDGDIEADISDLRVIFESAPNTDRGDIPTAIQCGGKGDGEKLRRVSINRVHVENAQSEYGASNYWNGDGITAERSLALLEITDAVIRNCTDAGIDTKAAKNILNWITVEGSLGNYKIWNDAELNNVTSINPIKRGGVGGRCHFRLMGGSTKPTVVIAKNVTAVGGLSLLSIQNGPVEFHGEGNFDGTTIVSKSDGGKLVAGSTWNGSVIV